MADERDVLSMNSEDDGSAAKREGEEKENNSGSSSSSPSMPNIPSVGEENEEEKEGEETEQESGEEEGSSEENKPAEKKDEKKVEKKSRIKTGADDEMELQRTDEGLAMRFSHSGQQELDELLKSREEREAEKAASEEQPELLIDEDEVKSKQEEAEEKEAERKEKEKAFRKRERRREQERTRKESEERLQQQYSEHDAVKQQAAEQRPAQIEGIPLVEDADAANIPGYGRNAGIRTFYADEALRFQAEEAQKAAEESARITGAKGITHSPEEENAYDRKINNRFSYDSGAINRPGQESRTDTTLKNGSGEPWYSDGGSSGRGRRGRTNDYYTGGSERGGAGRQAGTKGIERPEEQNEYDQRMKDRYSNDDYYTGTAGQRQSGAGGIGSNGYYSGENREPQQAVSMKRGSAGITQAEHTDGSDKTDIYAKDPGTAGGQAFSGIKMGGGSKDASSGIKTDTGSDYAPVSGIKAGREQSGSGMGKAGMRTEAGQVLMGGKGMKTGHGQSMEALGAAGETAASGTASAAGKTAGRSAGRKSGTITIGQDGYAGSAGIGKETGGTSSGRGSSAAGGRSSAAGEGQSVPGGQHIRSGKGAAGAGIAGIPLTAAQIAGIAMAAGKSRKNDEKDNSNPQMSDVGLSESKQISSGLTKFAAGSASIARKDIAGAATQYADGGVASANIKTGQELAEAAAKFEKTNSGIIRISASGKHVDNIEEAAAKAKKVRTQNILNIKKKSDEKISTSASKTRAGKGNLAQMSQDAKRQGNLIRNFQMKKGILPGTNPAQMPGTDAAAMPLKAKIKMLIKAAAKKVVAGAMATTLATGAIAGGSAVMRTSQDNTTAELWDPLQAHIGADGTDYGKSLTQETLEFLHARMRAYGIQTTYCGASSGMGGPLTIHVPAYPDGYYPGGYDDGGDGDSTFMFIGSECVLIDGGMGTLKDVTIDYIKQRGITEITAIISHWHGDHHAALGRLLRDNTVRVKTLYCPPPDEIRPFDSGEAGAGDFIVSTVKERGGEVIMPPAETDSQYNLFGLNMTMWRRTATGNDYVYGNWDIVNDSSLQTYFPDLYYFTCGDMSFHMNNFLDTIPGQQIKFFKCGHHGNGSDDEVVRLRNEFGLEACWYNDIGYRGEIDNWFVVAARKARSVGATVFHSYKGMDCAVNSGTFTVTGYDPYGAPLTFSYPCNYREVGGTKTNNVSDYALRWVGEDGKIIVPYKSSVTKNDPNDERKMPLAEGRGSDCSWFVYHVLMDCGILADDTEFIHSYEWGSKPELYPNGRSVGTDLSAAQPGDVLCYAYNYPRESGNSHVAIYIGNGEMVHCAAGAGGVVKGKASTGSLLDIVHFDKPAGTAKATIPNNIAPMSSTGMGGIETKYGFSPETEAIVEANMDKFDYDNFDSFMASYGGAEKYVLSLGGVFSKYVGVPTYVQTAGDFQEVAEYVMGICAIWGPDYRGGGGRHKFNANYGDGDYYGRFYSGENDRNWTNGSIEDIYFNDKERIMIDCGSGIEYITRKAGLYDGYGGEDDVPTARNKIDESQGGAIVFNKEELQVGDLIQMFRDSDRRFMYGADNSWGHVAIVGEIHSDGKILLYDTGNRFVNTGNYKKEFIVNSDGSLGGVYDKYHSWFGMRIRAIAQTGGISSGGSGAAVQNLGDIKINSVEVDGGARDPEDFSYKTLGMYSEGGKHTTIVNRKFKFIDENGEELHMSGLTSPSGGMTGGASSTVDNSVGSGPEIAIPPGLGSVHTYMGWQCITSPSSNQYKLREDAGQNFDSEGFGIINGRYVIACTETYGKVGDYIDFVKEDGLVLHCIMGEVKNRSNAGCNEWGHHDGKNIIEFCVDKDTWYVNGHGDHANPGTPSCHPEWNNCIVKAVNVGNYYGDPTTSLGGGYGGMGSGADTENAMYLALQVLSMSVVGSYYDEPHRKSPYQQYCFDTLDYAICESEGADVKYTTTGEDTMTCDVEVRVHCDMRMMEENDENFKSWEFDHPKGDPEPASYMTLPIKVINEVFNINTFAGAKGINPFTGNEAIVYEFFVSKGLQPAQIAGIMANIKAESSFNPRAVNSSSGAKGLFQWLGGRAAALDAYAASQGKEWTDINCQLEYAWTEIEDDAQWGGADKKEAFMSTSSAKEAGMLFCTYWERPGNEETAVKRGEMAEEYYATIMSAGPMGMNSNIDYVNWAIQTSKDESHGYSQGSRDGNPDYDCSSFVFYALKNSGYDVGGGAFTTDGMPSTLQRLGFKMIPLPDESQLMPGDILWWDGPGYEGHTEIYVGNGKMVGAHGCKPQPGLRRSPSPGDSGDEVSVKDYSPGSYTHIFRK